MKISRQEASLIPDLHLTYVVFLDFQKEIHYGSFLCDRKHVLSVSLFFRLGNMGFSGKDQTRSRSRTIQ